jgi:hypothetical protein
VTAFIDEHRGRFGVEPICKVLDGTRPDEIEAMLNAIPDLRPTLRAATPDELADLFDAFDVTAIYDKPNQTLELRATVTPRTRPRRRKTPTEQGPVGDIFIAGERYALTGDPAVPVEWAVGWP